MSAANAAARKRRAAPDNNPSVMSRPANFNSSQSAAPAAPPATGLTLPQVIALIDTRLVKLETFAKESANAVTSSPINQPANRELEITNNDVVFQEVDRRFEILATEINNLKDMLLKLQAYTMDVNKMLMEERVRVFSDMGNVASTSADGGFFLSDGSMTEDQEMASVDLKNLVNEELNN